MYIMKSEDSIETEVNLLIELYGEQESINMFKRLKREIDACIDDIHDAELNIAKYKYYLFTEYFKNKYKIYDDDSFNLWLSLQ